MAAVIAAGCTPSYPTAPTSVPLTSLQIYHQPYRGDIGRLDLWLGELNGSISLNAVTQDADGVYGFGGSDVQWTSSDPSVAAGSSGPNIAQGSIRLLRSGTSLIVASYRGLSASIGLVVRDGRPPEPYLRLVLNSLGEVSVNRAQAVASLIPTPFPSVPQGSFAWSSSNSAVIRFDVSSMFVVAPGITEVRASYQGVSATYRAAVFPYYSGAYPR